jgi:hypothetical protein
MEKEYVTIPIGGSHAAIVDVGDAWVARWKWMLHTKGYAYRRPTVKGGKHKTVFMHRAIMDPPDGMEIDHLNRNPLDNRRCNLRIATRSENHLNRGVSVKSKSGVSGVVWDAVRKKWRASITVRGAVHELGRFPEIEDAIAVRREAESHLGVVRCD